MSVIRRRQGDNIMFAVHRGLKCLAALVAFSFASHLQAAPITLAPGSSVEATAADEINTTVTDPVNALPFIHDTTAIQGRASSTVHSDLTTSALKLDFTASIPDFAYADGEGDIFFTAGEGVTYAISGFQTAFGAEFFHELSATLKDVTTQTTVYNYDEFKGVGFSGDEGSTLTLDSTGGDITGSLIAGHLYEFDALELITDITDPTSTGNVTIAFAQQGGPGPGPSVPLPASFPAALFTIAIGSFVVRRRIKGMSNQFCA
jgi:hypothetical protein